MVRRRWQGGDAGLTARMLLVMVLLAALYLAFVAVLVQAGVDSTALLLFAVVVAGAQLFFSDKIALWSVGARVVSEQEEPALHAMVERLAAMADLPKPAIAVAPTAIPNAFAVGRGPGSSVVAVTRGLLDQLEPAELEGVLAHELSHIRNRDVLVVTLASFFAVVAQLLVRSLMWSGMYGWGGGFGGYGGWGGRGDRRRDGGVSGIVLIYVASLAVWAISFLLIRALSRYREYAADRAAALLTGAPSALAAALAKLSEAVARIPDRDLREVEGMNAFFIVPATARASLAELFATHPSTEKRIERLMRLAAEMERPA